MGLRIAEQRAKTLLLEVPVVGEDFGQPFLAHRLHRNAICQAVPLVGPRLVESHSGEKLFPALRNDTDARSVKNTLGIYNGFAAHLLGRRCKKGKIVGQHFIRGDDRRVCPLGCKSQRALMGAVGEIARAIQ